MDRPVEHCVIRWCDKRRKAMVWMPFQTIEANKCPVLIIDDISRNLTHYEFLGILTYDTTRPGNTFEECRAVHRGIQSSKGWRINADSERAIKYGRPVQAGFTTETFKEEPDATTQKPTPTTAETGVLAGNPRVEDGALSSAGAVEAC